MVDSCPQYRLLGRLFQCWKIFSVSKQGNFSGKVGLNIALGLVTSCYSHKTPCWGPACCLLWRIVFFECLIAARTVPTVGKLPTIISFPKTEWKVPVALPKFKEYVCNAETLSDGAGTCPRCLSWSLWTIRSRRSVKLNRGLGRNISHNLTFLASWDGLRVEIDTSNRESNSDRRSKKQTRWPLNHYHGPKVSI